MLTNENRYTIGVAAKLLNVHPRTLRIYESEGLLKPARKSKWRYYTQDDLQWVQCLRKMIHEQGISIAAIKKLLNYTSCWKILNCPPADREQCREYLRKGKETE
ncbi:MAG: MerR family transcriptional regulator [Deltaproteobacteria bacterium RIFOXYD12_FULL_50_9]|nr:MAG: MerR family transcriptional regulator [Deltaproteobacteria bacterium RIFOXYD12_FULL_50_9]